MEETLRSRDLVAGLTGAPIPPGSMDVPSLDQPGLYCCLYLATPGVLGMTSSIIGLVEPQRTHLDQDCQLL